MDQKSWENLHHNIYYELTEVRKELTEIKVEIAMLKVKASFWGAAASVIILIPGMIFYLMTK